MRMAARPQAASTSRSFPCRPDPVGEKKEPPSAAAKCGIRKIFDTVSSQAGGFWRGMKMFEIKSSGRIEALTTAGDASALGITAVIAIPRAQKVAAPTTRVSKKDGSVWVGSVAP